MIFPIEYREGMPCNNIYTRDLISYIPNIKGRCLHHQEYPGLNIRPPLDKKWFPVHRPGGLKRARWKLFFIIFEKKFSFSQSSQYILVNEKWKTEKKKSRPPDWLFWESPGGQETLFLLKDGLRYCPPTCGN